MGEYELEMIIKSLVLSCPGGLSMNKLNNDFETEMGYSIPFRKLGHISLEQYLLSLDSSVVLSKQNGVTYVRAKSSNKTKHIEFMISEQKKARPRKFGFNNKKESTACRRPCSGSFDSKTKLNTKIHSSEIKEQNGLKSLKNLNPKVPTNESYDKNNLQKSLSDTLEIVENNLKKIIPSKLLQSEFHLNTSAIHPNIQVTDSSDSLLKDSIEEPDIFINIPLNDEELNFKGNDEEYLDDKCKAVIGDKIPPAIHSTDIEIGTTFCLYVSEVNNPYKFWFHIEENSNKLDKLMYAIELFNQNVSKFKNFNMMLSDMIPEQLCCAMYSELWHRAKILQIPINHMVKVYFVDYGTVTYVPTSSIRYIHKDFIKIPSQVFRGCLSYLKPANVMWKRDCTHFLANIIYDKKLWAKLIDFDNADNIYHLMLVDTNNECDVNINNSLVKRGFGDILKNSSEVETHFQYVYPTFDMLESGEYASFEEIGRMLVQGEEYEIDQYKTLKSINSERLYGCSTVEFWNFIKRY